MVQYSFNEADAPKSLVVPAGDYLLHAVESELKQTKSGDGEYLRFRFAVASGPYMGSSVWMNFNVNNPSAIAVQIAQRQLGEFSRAVGVPHWTNTQDLHNKIFKATVIVETGQGAFGDQNTITKFMTDNSGVDPLRSGGDFQVEDQPSGAQAHTPGSSTHMANGSGMQQASHAAGASGRPDWGRNTG